MPTGLTRLIDLLTLDEVGPDQFRGAGSEDDGVEATFGGHFLGQATAAAQATVDDDRRIHSLHAYFLRGGAPGVPFDLEVDRVRDGRSFCTRRVRTTQAGGKLQFELLASFSVDEKGAVLDPSPPSGFADLPDPESLPTYHELMSGQDPLPLPEAWALRDPGVDIRTVNAPWAPSGVYGDGGIRLWIRASDALPDDPRVHAALLAYQSDESLADTVAAPFGATWGTPGVAFVSLDHALWYHRPFRMDEWLFVDQEPVTVGRARGRAEATVWNTSGEMVASFTQEALLRLGD